VIERFFSPCKRCRLLWLVQTKTDDLSLTVDHRQRQIIAAFALVLLDSMLHLVDTSYAPPQLAVPCGPTRCLCCACKSCGAFVQRCRMCWDPARLCKSSECTSCHKGFDCSASPWRSSSFSTWTCRTCPRCWPTRKVSPAWSMCASSTESPSPSRWTATANLSAWWVC